MVRTPPFLSLFLMLTVVLSLIQCGAPQPMDDPVAGMADTQLAAGQRLRAADQAAAEEYDNPQRIAMLQTLVTKFGHPPEIRIRAIDHLVAYDAEDARQFLSRDLDTIRSSLVIEHAIDIALERQWSDWTPALVRRYAKLDPMVGDDERVERRALLELNPGQSIEQIVMDVFVDPTFSTKIYLRAMAWQLLYRLTGDDATRRAMLMSAEARDPLIADLQIAARDLNVLAENVQSITWLQMLRTEPYARFWNQASRVVSQLTTEQRQDLEARHLPVLVYLGENRDRMLTLSRRELLRDLGQFVGGGRHHMRGSNIDGPMDKHPQVLNHWADELVWADLATMHVMTRMMSDSSARRQWFEQADADHRDKSTEYGGLIALDEGGSVFPKLYKPMMRRHDKVYYAPKELVIDAYTSLAHYHFHVASQKNRNHAGPGYGDLKRIARLQQFNGLVLTFIDADRLNVDFYCKPSVVVDLGTIHR